MSALSEFYDAILTGNLAKAMAVQSKMEFNLNSIALTPSGLSPLVAAAYFDHVNVMEWLLEKKATVDSRFCVTDNPSNDWSGMTALHFASIHGRSAAAALLVENKATVDLARPADGATPLMLAVRTRAGAGVVRLLLDHHADPTVQGTAGVFQNKTARDVAHPSLRQLLPLPATPPLAPPAPLLPASSSSWNNIV